MSGRASIASLVAAIALAGCVAPPAVPAPAYAPEAPLPGSITVAFTIPRTADPPPFFDLPWPNELRKKPDGRPDFRGYPGHDTALFGPYVDAAEEDVDGYGLTPAITFRFTGSIPTAHLPLDPRATASIASPIVLVDVDPESPERGAFVPIEHRYHDRAQRFVPAHVLALKPAAGVVLRPATLYAAVVRRDLGGPSAALGTPLDLELVKWTAPRADAREERARRLHEGAFDLLGSLGLPRDRVGAIALFRTHAPHRITERLVQVIAHLPADRAPRVIDAELLDELASPRLYDVIEGTYCTPSFQTGLDHAPFLTGEGGRFALDAAGSPRVVPVPPHSRHHDPVCGDLLRARFVLSVPAGRSMPRGGWPLLLSAHGTGGDARSFLGVNDFAGWAAQQGIAVLSTDQPLHGSRGRAPRPGSRDPVRVSLAGIPFTLTDDPEVAEIAFYNPLNPAAARDNLRQAAADLMVLARLFPAVDLARFLPSGRIAPRFDATRILAAGHSQGSQSVAVVGAVDPLIRGVVLSGCGGDARLGILHREDLPIVPAFAALLGLEPGELDDVHPLLTLLQTLADPIDPASYARMYWDPPPGRRAPRMLHYEGVSDTFTPPITAEALAVALRATPVTDLVRPVAALARPVRLADLVRREAAPRAFVQLASTRGENGHFVLFREPGAPLLLMEFLRAAIERP